MPICADCGGTVIEYDTAAGNGFCIKCGTVVEENTIVSEVTFGETSSGAAMVQGSFIAQGSTHARLGGPFGNRSSAESREQTIANASKKIRNVASVMHLSEVVSSAAIRMYTLAVEHKFTKGRKSMNVVAVCLYIACRQKETRNYMLIDFSDLLQVNVFELGHTYLQLVQTLNLRLPLVDPSHYVARFAALLEFGTETSRVAADAVRLVARFDRDWMTRGRRPAGVCGACLLLAARMNNFRRSIQEIVQVVKIADSTLKKRLDEFKATPSSALTLADFRSVWLEEEVDPPAFTRGREKELKEAREREKANGLRVNEEEETGRGSRRKGKKSRKRTREVDDEEMEYVDPQGFNGQSTTLPARDSIIDPQLLDDSIFAGSMPELPLFLPEQDGAYGEGAEQAAEPPSEDAALVGCANIELAGNNSARPDDPTDTALASELVVFLSGEQGSALAAALEEAESRRRAQIAPNDDGEDLTGLDEAELDAFILTEEEVRIKERVWVEINKDYLEALAAKQAALEGVEPAKPRKRRKTLTSSKPRDASTPHGRTAEESVRNLIKKNPKYSKRINYDALRDLFGGEGDGTGAAGAGGGEYEDNSLLVPPNISLDEKEEDMYRLDDVDKSDGEGMFIVEESGGGGVGTGKGAGEENELVDEDGEGEEIGYAWDEGYEQEV